MNWFKKRALFLLVIISILFIVLAIQYRTVVNQRDDYRHIVTTRSAIFMGQHYYNVMEINLVTKRVLDEEESKTNVMTLVSLLGNVQEAQDNYAAAMSVKDMSSTYICHLLHRYYCKHLYLW